MKPSQMDGDETKQLADQSETEEDDFMNLGSLSNKYKN